MAVVMNMDVLQVQAELINDNDDLNTETKFNLLMDSIDKILLKQSSEISFVSCYSYCFKCVTEQMGAQIHTGVKSVYENHFNQRIRSKIIDDLHEKNVKTLIEEWDINFVAAKKIRDVLLFLDNNYILANNNLKPVFDLIMLTFREMTLENHEMIELIQNIIFEMIHNERQRNQIEHRDTIKRIIDFLLNVKLNSDYDNRFDDYENYFENQFIEKSKSYYDGLAQLQLTKNDAIEYIKLYELKVKHEKERIQLYLHQRTESKILKVVEDEMIGSKLLSIINLDKGLNWMLDNSCKTELKLIYKWYGKFNTLNSFKDIIAGRYLELSKSTIKPDNQKNLDQAAKDFFDLYDKFIEFCNECWEEDLNDFKYILEENCRTALNQNNRSPQILASFINEKIKLMRKDYSDHQINCEIEKFINYFKLLDGKDSFQPYYEHHLSSRLLTKNADIHLEKKIAQKLQLECGSYYVKKINDKLMDMVINEDHMKLYYDHQNVKAQDDFKLLKCLDFTILILRSFSWSFNQQPQINLPLDLKQSYDSYIKFYSDIHTGRKIVLQPNKGSAVIQASYPEMLTDDSKQLEKRKYTFETSPLQMFVLLEFNKADRLEFDQIQTNTNIAKEDLEIVIKSLLGSKVIKSDGAKDSYLINLEYSNKSRRCRLMPENRKIDKRKVIEKIDVDNKSERLLKIEAATVRIMKARKKLNHGNLLAEVINILKEFRPEVNLIEQSFKKLIDKEYIKISETDRSQYVYLA